MDTTSEYMKLFPNYGKAICAGFQELKNHPKKMLLFKKCVLKFSGSDTAMSYDELIVCIKKYLLPLQKLVHPTSKALDNYASIADSPTDLHKLCVECLEELFKCCLTQNMIFQCTLICIQFAALYYLYRESNRTQVALTKEQRNLDKIRKKYIEPALGILYDKNDTFTYDVNASINCNGDYEEKYHCNQLRTMNESEITRARFSLDVAVDMLEREMEIVADKKEGAAIKTITGGILLVGCAGLTCVYAHGLSSILPFLKRTTEVAQLAHPLIHLQLGMTVAQATATAGMAWVTFNHAQNFKQCRKFLDELTELKRFCEHNT